MLKEPQDGGDKTTVLLNGRRSGGPSPPSKRFSVTLEMPPPAPPAPAPMPMSPKRDRGQKEKEKAQEREEQRENVLLGFRASAETMQAAAHPLTMEGLASLMSGMLDEMKSDFATKLDRAVQEIKNDFAKELDTICEGMIQNFQRVDESMQSMDKKFEDQNKVIEDQAIVAEARQLETVVRIRGISEAVGNLELEAAGGLAQGLEMTETEMRQHVDKIYRVNSRAARERNLPRDTVLYLTKRSLRDTIIRKSFEKKFQIAGQDVIIMKELPPRYVKRKREYKFLAEELRKRKIKFRWEIPDGLTVSYQESTFKLGSIREAREFYDTLMKERPVGDLQEVRQVTPPAAEAPVEERTSAEQLGAVGGARPKMTTMQLRERLGRGRARK